MDFVKCHFVEHLTIRALGAPKTTAFQFTACDNNTVSQNSSLNTGEGFYFNGGGSNIDFNYNSIGRYNDPVTWQPITGLHNYGLRIGAGTMIGQQVLKGNTWEGTYSLAGARNDDADPTIVGNSLFSVNDGNSCTSFPLAYPPFMPAVSVVFPVTISNFFACTGIPQPAAATTCGNGSGNRIGQYSDLDEEIAEGDVSFTEFEETQNWEADRELYHRLVQDSTLTDSLFIAYRDSVEGINVGIFETLHQATVEVFSPTALANLQLSAYLGQINAYADSLQRVDSLLNTHPMDSLYWFEARNTVLATLSMLNNQYQTLSATLSASRNAALDAIMGDNSSMIVDEIYEINTQIVNDIYLSTIARGVLDYSTTQVQQLENLIYQCPLAGGRAVYQARALYTLVNDSLVYTNDSLNCAVLGLSWRQIKPTVQDEVQLIPNPASHSTRVIWDKEIYPAASIGLYSLLGKQQMHVKTIENTGEIEVDIASLSQGFYIFQLMDAYGNPIKNVKFIKE
jgi:hypothetical protein